MEKNKDVLINNRNTMIDVIKGICIIFVIITHYDWTDSQRLIAGFPYTIDMAVPIFMIISGYVFTCSYGRKEASKLGDVYRFNTLGKRLIRYTVPFLFVYIVELFLLYLNGTILSSINIFESFFTGGFGPGSYYYPEMIQLTLFFPLIYISVRRNPDISILLWFIINFIFEFVKPFIGLNQEIYRLLLLRYVFAIAFGCYIYFCKGTRNRRLCLVNLFILGFMYIFITMYLGHNTYIIDNNWRGTSYMSVLYIAPIIKLLLDKYESFSFRPLEIVGKASYHIFLTQLVYYRFIAGPLTTRIGYDSIVICLNVIICVSMGITFYHIDKIVMDVFSMRNRCGTI